MQPADQSRAGALIGIIILALENFERWSVSRRPGAMTLAARLDAGSAGDEYSPTGKREHS
jgi:hypothetical protein